MGAATHDSVPCCAGQFGKSFAFSIRSLSPLSCMGLNMACIVQRFVPDGAILGRGASTAAIATVRRRAPSSHVASPIDHNSYLLLHWSIIALGHRCSRHSLVYHYHRRLARTCDYTACTRHGHELQLAVADFS